MRLEYDKFHPLAKPVKWNLLGELLKKQNIYDVLFTETKVKKYGI